MEISEEQVRQMVCARIGEVENQVRSLQELRKTLLQRAYETKQDIMSSCVAERESMYNKEMTMLCEVDNLLHSKDDCLVTQLNKLNQVLGCLRNCLESPHPCGDCLEKYEDIDMLKVEEVDMEFRSAQELLKNTCSIALRLSSENTMEVSDGEMTKWLLTPTNNHSTEDNVRAGQEDFTSTEWLTKYHSQAKPAIETGSHFQSVMTAKRDDWLTDSSISGSSSLYLYALTHFESIVAEAAEVWLEKASEKPGRERSFSASVSEASIATSSVSSSCVIIPSVTSYSSSSTYISKPPLFSSSEEPTSHVDQWVAKCESGEEWLVTDRPRRMSTGSACFKASPMTTQTHTEWLVGGSEPSSNEDFTTLLNSSDDWLSEPVKAPSCCGEEEEEMDTALLSAADNEDWVNSTPISQQEVQAWLPLITSKMEDLADEYPDEKLDISIEKTDSDDWLVRVTAPDQVADNWSCNKGCDWLCEETAPMPQKAASVGFPSKTDWLSGEEKKDESAKVRGAAASLDREWLLVINEMSKISSSALSGWLAAASDSTNSAPGPINQDTNSAKLCNWLR